MKKSLHSEENKEKPEIKKSWTIWEIAVNITRPRDQKVFIAGIKLYAQPHGKWS